MKKLFTLLFLAISGVGFAQVGLSSTMLYDDFNSSEDYGDENGGVFWWGKENFGDIGNTGDPMWTNFKAVFTRDSINSQLSWTIDQAAGGWIPVGISLGEDLNLDPAVLNLSGDATFELIVKNDGDSTIDVSLGISDINKDVINAYSNENNILMTLTPGQENTLSGTFAGGFLKSWDAVKCGNAGTPCFFSDFDFTQVVGVDISFTNNNVNASWEPYELSNYPVSIKSIKIGSANSSSVIEDNGKVFDAYPNPISQGATLQFSSQLSNIRVFDIVGNLVMSLNSASTINTSGLAKGVYFINSAEGVAKFTVK